MASSILNSIFRSLGTSVSAQIPAGALYGFSPLTRRWVQEGPPPPKTSKPEVLEISVLSWNIDFMKPYVTQRWKVALDNIQHLLCLPTPAILLFQETATEAFPAILSHPFVREHFLLSNTSPPSGYSTLILVSRALLSCCEGSVTTTRVRYGELSKMNRDCLYVDLEVSLANKTRRARIATTHLESLDGFGTATRPKQLALAAQLLTNDDIDGGLVAGDMNCIGPDEETLPERTGLTDAWIAVKGSDAVAEEGYTWGYQPPSRFPKRRMDKILTVGKLEVTEIQRVGVGLEAEIEPGEKAWVSDHFGLLAKVVLR
ncbi:Tyrosyl-DNA phosphodiesterase 2 [Mycena kentingensis (nom. inval.)]|nr:Tyrosyl-DNA phosphodiesterase 2 [Mycena kentingensis (nom. inval.)]